MIKLTVHAEDMIEDRKIEFSWIVDTIAQPAVRVPDPKDPTLTRSYGKISAAGGRTLRVVHRPDGADVLVISAFFDRGMKL
jgi:hypothetical protein